MIHAGKEAEKNSKNGESMNFKQEAMEKAETTLAPYARWEQLLTPAPQSIALLGQLMVIATENDFSLEEKIPRNGFQYLQYPNSFRATLVQMTNIGWEAFNEAHVNMDGIRLHTTNIDAHIQSIVKVLMKGTIDDVNTLIPIPLKNIKRIADECVELSVGVEKRFILFMQATGELLEASTSAQGTYENHLKETKIAIEVAKTEEKQANDEKKEIDKRYQEINNDIQRAQDDFREALKSMPSTGKLFGLAVTDAFVGIVKMFTGSSSQTTFEADQFQSVQETAEDRAKKGVYKFAGELNHHIQTIVDVSTSGKGKGEKEPSWKDVDLVRVAKESIRVILNNMKRDSTFTEIHQRGIKLCTDAIRVCEHLIDSSKEMQQNPEIIKNIIIEAEDIHQASRSFLSEAALFLRNTFSENKGPKRTKRTESNLVQTELKNSGLKVEVTKEILKESRKRQESVILDMKENNGRMEQTLIDLKKFDMKKVDFEEIRKTLIKGLRAIKEAREQWGKLVRFFQMVSNLVKFKFHNSVGNFIEYVEVGTNQKLEKKFISDVTRELIYDQAFQLSTITNVVNVISSTYVEVSTEHLMDQINSLGGLASLDPSTDQHEIMKRRNELFENCHKTQKRIAEIAIRNQQNYVSQASKKLKLLESQTLSGDQDEH